MMAERNVEAVYPLTPLQEGMLFHSLRDSDTDVYFIQYECLIEGDLDSDCLRRAWDSAAGRHAALRTLFSWARRDRPLQVVRARVELPWETIDWRGVAAERAQAAWGELLEQDRSQPFDLARAPLMRIRLVRESADRWRLLWTVHHLLMDGWSGRLLLREVFDDCAALQAGMQASTTMGTGFGEFVAWCQSQDQSAAREHWQQRLRGFEPPAPLHLGGRQTSATTTRSTHASHSVELDLALSQALKRAARDARVTANTVMLGAWAIVLGRYLQSSDIVFGSTVTTRPAAVPGVETAIGLYMNTIPVRARIDPAEELAAWLRSLQEATAADREHGHAALNDIQRWTGFGGGQDLFETLVSYEGFPPSVSERRLERAFRVTGERLVEHSNYPLALLVVPEERLQLILVYAKARVAPEAVARLAEHLKTVLAAFVRDLSARVGDLPVLTADEVQRQLHSWCTTPPPETTQDVLTLFEAHAASAPERTAIRSGGVSVSYGELDRRARSIASRLRDLGSGPGSHAVILATRSADTVAAMLAALKVGAAYVPADPSTPPERLHRVLGDLDRPVVITPNGEAPISDAVILNLGEAPASGDFSTGPSTPRDAAYVMFTSGSTGAPKGVAVERGNLAWSNAARLAYYPNASPVFLLLSPLSVDSSIAGVYWALCSGGALVLPDDRAEQDVAGLARLIESERITHTLLVPSLWETIVEAADPARLSSLSCVVVAGEACSPEVVRRHHEAIPQCALYNEYGPSEGTVWATVEKLRPEERPVVSIGRPAPGAQVYVLDAELRLLPEGTPGEICVGGPGVARGYLRRPELTAAKFVANPFGAGRLYRTGDHGRHLPDGRIEFLGRLDRQVKIRGRRVELEEIELAISQHPAVREAAVIPLRPKDPDLDELLERIPAAEAAALLDWVKGT